MLSTKGLILSLPLVVSHDNVLDLSSVIMVAGNDRQDVVVFLVVGGLALVLKLFTVSDKTETFLMFLNFYMNYLLFLIFASNLLVFFLFFGEMTRNDRSNIKYSLCPIPFWIIELNIHLVFVVSWSINTKLTLSTAPALLTRVDSRALVASIFMLFYLKTVMIWFKKWLKYIKMTLCHHSLPLLYAAYYCDQSIHTLSAFGITMKVLQKRNLD